MKRPFFFPAGPALIALLFLFSSPAVYPQTPVPAGPPTTLPPGPWLTPVPDNTRWTLTTVSKAEETANPGEKSRRGRGTGSAKDPKSSQKPKGASTMVGEEMGKTSHVLIVAANGAKIEKWTDGNLTAIMNPGAKDLFFTTGSAEEMPTPSWISQENCVAIKTEGQKKSFVFRSRIIPKGTEIVKDMENSEEPSTSNLEVEATAVIDADTHLPMTVTEGAMTTTYKFELLAPGTQIIPAAIQAILTERGKEVQDAVRKPARP